MKKSLLKIVVFTLLAGAVAFAPGRVQAQESTNAAPAAPAAPKTLRIRGIVKSIDKTEMTIHVGKFDYKITSQTKLFKDNKPATLEDVVPGDYARGMAKLEGGKPTALRVAFGPAPEKSAAPSTPAPSTPPPADTK